MVEMEGTKRGEKEQMLRRNWMRRQWFEKGGWKGEQREKQRKLKVVCKRLS
jgi:hypothetical protein